MSPKIDALLSGPVGTRIREHVSAGDLELPVLPATVTEVLSLCNSHHCDARVLAQHIESDPSLAGHVLRIANSAAYAPNEEIVSLAQAVARLGTGVLCEIVVSVAVRGKVFAVPGFAPKLVDLWRHSAVAGSFAKEIARTLRRNVEGAFLCGLLHDVGKPMALQILVDEMTRAGQKDKLDDETVEAVMDAFHEVIGGALIANWKLTSWIESAVLFHHRYDEAGGFRAQAMMANLADQLSHWALGTSELDEEELEALPVVSELGIYDDEFAQLLAKRAEVLAIAEAFA